MGLRWRLFQHGLRWRLFQILPRERWMLDSLLERIDVDVVIDIQSGAQYRVDLVEHVNGLRRLHFRGGDLQRLVGA